MKEKTKIKIAQAISKYIFCGITYGECVGLIANAEWYIRYGFTKQDRSDAWIDLQALEAMRFSLLMRDINF